jgi:conjugal transfer pilus assembly protein TraK
MAAGEGLAENGVPAEVPTLVELSSREINRIVCPGPMTDLIFSEEKGLTGHFSGNNAFIKFTAEEANGKRTYSEEPSEIYAVCNGAVYTLIATPTETSAVTVRLAAAKTETVAENLERYRNLPLEKQALQLLREGYSGAYPGSYRVSDMQVSLRQTVEVDGVGLRLKTFQVTSRLSTESELEEKTFLDARIGNPILAVALVEHRLQPGGSTRVLVVERKERDPGTMETLDTTLSAGGE